MGIWSGNPADGQINLRINAAFGRSARGSGRADLRGTSAIDRVSFEGSNRDGDFTFAFGARGGDGRGVTTSIDLSLGQFTTTRGGAGTMTLGDESERLNQGRLKVLRNGTAQLRVWGRSRHTLTGRWTGSLSSPSLTVDFDGYGNDDAGVTGSITTSRKNGWDKINLAGTVRGDPFALTFDASGLPLEGTDENATDDASFGKALEKLAVTMVGEGDIRVNGRATGTLVAARAELRRDGRATLSIQGSEERISLGGTWTPGESHRAECRRYLGDRFPGAEARQTAVGYRRALECAVGFGEGHWHTGGARAADSGGDRSPGGAGGRLLGDDRRRGTNSGAVHWALDSHCPARPGGAHRHWRHHQGGAGPRDSRPHRGSSCGGRDHRGERGAPAGEADVSCGRAPLGLARLEIAHRLLAFLHVHEVQQGSSHQEEPDDREQGIPA